MKSIFAWLSFPCWSFLRELSRRLKYWADANSAEYAERRRLKDLMAEAGLKSV
jgi:hypothetical protein